MSGYRIEPFADQTRVDEQAIVELWTGERILPLEEARRRVAEVLLVGTVEGSDEPVGISSVYLARHPQLQLDLWHQRGFVTAEHRRTRLATDMALGVRDLLRERWASGDRRAAGIVMEVEHEGLKREWPIAHWYWVDYLYVGDTPAGSRIYVHYFPGALAPEPQGTT